MLGSDNVDKIGTILCVPWVDTYTMVGVEEKKSGDRFFFRSLPPRAKSGRFSPAVTAMVVVLPGDVIHEAAPSLPARLLRSREDADQIAESRAQQQKMAQGLQAAQMGAGALKDAAAAAGAKETKTPAPIMALRPTVTASPRPGVRRSAGSVTGLRRGRRAGRWTRPDGPRWSRGRAAGAARRAGASSRTCG